MHKEHDGQNKSPLWDILETVTEHETGNWGYFGIVIGVTSFAIERLKNIRKKFPENQILTLVMQITQTIIFNRYTFLLIIFQCFC